MSVITKDLGAVTAYAAAVNRGYTGSREEFEILMAKYAYVGEQAAESASNASQSATNASQSAQNAETAKGTAQQAATDAQTAQASAQGYARSAQQSAQSASQSAQNAESAKNTAVNAVDGFAAGAQQALNSVNQAGVNWKSLAQGHALDSEAWALGTRDGEDVGTSDPAYNNNAKWYAEQTATDRTAAQTAAQTATTKASEAQASASAAAESARTLTIDATLTQSGQAADAKVVGDEIADLKSGFNDINDELFVSNPPVFAWQVGSIGSNGVDIESTATIRTVSDVYYKTDGTLIIGVDTPDVQFAVAKYGYNEHSQTYMPRGRTSWGSNAYQETTYEYVRVSMRWADQRTVSDTSLSSHLVLNGMLISNIDGIKAKINALNEQVDGFDSFEQELLIRRENVFDKNDTGIVDGFYLGAGGTEVALEGQSISGYIDELSDTMCLKYDPVTGASATLASFDSNKAFLSFLDGTFADGIGYFTIPDTAKYLRFNMKTSEKESVMLVKGSVYPSAYVDYDAPYKKIGDDIHLSYTMVEDVHNMLPTSKIYGKSIAITGDSIAYGAGYVGGYGKIIAEKNHMTIQNIAVAGATIMDTTNISPTNMCIADSVANLNAYDYILLEGGVNDASYQVNIGEYSRLRLIPSNPSTFYQYLDKMLGTAIELFHDKKIGFVITHAPIYRFSATDNSVYYDAIVKSCKKWGISYCDLNVECPPFGLFSAEGNPDLYALRSLYTKDGDGWHPNEAGYKLFYCDKIESFLNSL